MMDSAGEFIELQGTGEEATFSEAQLAEMLALGKIRRAGSCSASSRRRSGRLE